MSMSITGLGSGFDIDSWVSSLVSVKKSNTVTPLQTKLSTLQSQNSAVSGLKTKYSALQSALQTFTRTMYNSSNDMWVDNKVTSSDSDYVTASSSGIVSASDVEIKVDSIATATVAKSHQSIGSFENILNTEFTKLANRQALTGTFSMFVDNKKYEINIEAGNTLEQVLEKINNVGVDESHPDSILSAELNERTGILTIKPVNQNSKLVLGSSGDTSNIVSALKLYKKSDEHNGFESAYAVSKINTSAAIVSEESGLGTIDLEGTGIIKINGAEIKIDETTSINDLISKINNNSDTHVKASYDSLTNRLILTATQTGSSNIALEEKNTNLLTVLGLTKITDEGDEILHPDSQKLGDNAVVQINGNDIISNSNTITGASSGIANLSITIKKPTAQSEEDDAPASIKIGIEADHSKVKSALQTFVSAYNDVVSSTKSAVDKDGTFAHDSSLQSLLNTVKSVTTTTSANKGDFSLLSQIGITTSSTDPTQLTIDENKLSKALSENFDSVKYLLSDGYADNTDNGLFDKLLKNVDNMLDTNKGYFSNKTKSIDSQISLLNSRLERANKQLTSYETRVTAQFNRMDSIMSQLTSQLSTFQAYLGNNY